jgi:hypothetical protein
MSTSRPEWRDPSVTGSGDEAADDAPRWEEVDPATIRFLRENIRTVMITHRKDGSPTGHPMSAFFGVNGLFLNTYAKSAKMRNLARDPRLCCLVTSFEPAERRQAVLVRGNARLVANDEPERFGDEDGIRRARLASPLSSGSTGDTAEDPEEAARRRERAAQRVAEGKRVIFELVPVEIGSPARPRPQGRS